MLVDSYGRVINYIRISITKRCNFRCMYCMPHVPMDLGSERDDIPFEKLLHFVKIAIDEGVNKIRITGGEPLLRKGVVGFIEQINQYKSNLDLALTTNAYYLSSMAQDLKNAGLKRINISLDSLKKEHIICLSKRDALDKILLGIQKATEAGFVIKLNMVPLRGINQSQIIEILEFGMERNIMVRFIEFMENVHASSLALGLRSQEILQIISQKYRVKFCSQEIQGPSQLFALTLQKGEYHFGIIAPHHDDFCKSCNRIRLSSEGKLIPCLYHQNALDIKEEMLDDDIRGILQKLKLTIANKPEKNDWNKGMISSRAFYQTGG